VTSPGTAAAATKNRSHQCGLRAAHRQRHNQRQHDNVVRCRWPADWLVNGKRQTLKRFLYTLLVSDEPVMQAFELAVEEDETKGLGSEISHAFAELHILRDASDLMVRNPIVRDQAIRGRHVTHKPSFSQQNGLLYVYEAIDFTMKKPKVIRERAGWMAYMYTDIKQAEQKAETYSIYRPTQEDASDIVQYAKGMLGGESTLVNWADENERKTFLNQRQRVAETLNLQGGGARFSQ
jgi:hypothetical protein